MRRSDTGIVMISKFLQIAEGRQDHLSQQWLGHARDSSDMVCPLGMGNECGGGYVLRGHAFGLV